MNITNKNIVLIGFMGTGKTVTARVLARKLGRRMLELDRLIEKQERKSIPQIFAKKGEPYFRRAERKALRRAVKQSNLVLATGGGAILNPANVKDLKRNGVVVCLTASIRQIYARVRRHAHRPLLQNKNPFQTIKNLLKSRRPLYRKAADLFVNTTGDTPAQTAAKIFKRLEKWK